VRQETQKLGQRIDLLDQDYESLRTELGHCLRQSQVNSIIPPLKGDYSMHIMREQTQKVSKDYDSRLYVLEDKYQRLVEGSI
jgi:hypothetical protein